MALIVASAPLHAQDGSFGSGAGGFATGVVGGVLIGAGSISARAVIFGRPNYGFADGLKVGIPAAAVTLVAATWLGATDSDRMSEVREHAAIGAAGGGALGLGLGLLFDRDKPLGLTTVGVAAGIIIGTIVAVLDDEDDSVALSRAHRVELIRLRISL